MQLFVVYERPRDARPGYPYVVRRWEVAPGYPDCPREAMCAQTIDAARSLVPPGMHRLPHQPGEDACILETWI